ncbi:hypothetical protein N7509_000232 [Penicillium cosmopolitanum]|uniref:Uncharacterized protein n=1 Tax=Penicillium cosmopolitanum TaxID=1131564 RepID=A0A9W9WCX2_9EURO|nr:uncharacterized protein N7509_000232 [Penicillium cosmopolitanum]KAJ5414898.1 hypothetical protein N7509_000232 [Penicillium cosmopolitanum]
MSFLGAGFGVFIVASLKVPDLWAIAKYGLWASLELSFWSLYFGGREEGASVKSECHRGAAIIYCWGEDSKDFQRLIREH